MGGELLGVATVVEQPIDHRRAFVLGLVAGKRLGLFVTWDATDQVEEHPAEPLGIGFDLGRLETIFLPILLDGGIDQPRLRQSIVVGGW